MKKIILFSIILVQFLASCTTTSPVSLQRRSEDEYYLSTGQVRYFLSEIPYWANGSKSGKCFRRESSRYFDIKALRQSYNLTYEEAIQLQFAYNLELFQLRKQNTSGVLPLSQEEELFLQVSEKISSNIKSLQIPDYNRINVIWIDSISDANRAQTLKRFLNSENGMKGYPILLSFCHSSLELSEWFQNKVGNMTAKFAGHELLSPYDDISELTPEMSTFWDQLFKPSQNVTFYKTKDFAQPVEVKSKKYSWKNID